MIRALRLFILKRDLDRKLRLRRIATQARSEAARRGVSTYWQRSGRKCRQMFGSAHG